MPPDLHAELTRAAEREGTSLNALITRRLTESVGWGKVPVTVSLNAPACCRRF